MYNINSILIDGVIKEEPLYRETQEGTPVSMFTIMLKQSSKNEDITEEKVSFFDVEAWGKLGIVVRDKGHRDQRVRVVGRLKEDRWTTSDGKLHSKVSILAEHIVFLNIPENQ